MASRQTKDEAKIKELEQQIAANQEANDEFARAIIRDNRNNWPLPLTAQPTTIIIPC